MADLARKKRTQAAHKASVMKTTTKVGTALTAEPVDVAGLPLLKLTLNEKLEVIRTLDAEVIELIEEEEALTNEIQQADTYRESIHSYLLRIEAALGTPAATPPTGRATLPTAGETATASTSTIVKLPRLKLKAFAGDLTQWTPFWQSFKATAHSNTSLTPVEKFSYLNSVVEGTAQEAISGLSLTAANYEQVVTTLSGGGSSMRLGG